MLPLPGNIAKGGKVTAYSGDKIQVCYDRVAMVLLSSDDLDPQYQSIYCSDLLQ